MKPTDKNYDLLSAEMRLIWGDDAKMFEWEMKEFKRVYVINDNNDFIALTNMPITNEFYFGYSDCGQGPSYDDMSNTIDWVRKNLTRYFIERNTSHLEEELKNLRDETIPFGVYVNYGRGKHCMCFEKIERWTNLNEMKMRVMTKDERKIIIKAYEVELERMTRRCITWLKRYGEKKLIIRTYWMDR